MRFVMNIFVLDKDPIRAAQLQCDKHVVKMIVESAQLLSTAHRMLDGKLETRLSKSGRKQKYYALDASVEDVYYRACHHNHPSNVWARESDTNYNWLYRHFVALCDEYKYRYGKVHATDTKLRDALATPPRNIPVTSETPFKLAMGSNPECIDNNDPIGSYRKFYQTKQDRFKMVWTKRTTPEWFNVKSGEMKNNVIHV
jgi:hypothetical protein